MSVLSLRARILDDRTRQHLVVYLFFLVCTSLDVSFVLGELTRRKYEQNRYLIPLSFIINLYAYFSRSWTLNVSLVYRALADVKLYLNARDAVVSAGESCLTLARLIAL